LLWNVERQQDGVDLSDAEEITLDVSYNGPAERLSLTLKNHDPAYSRAGRPETDKMNEIEVPVRRGRQTFRRAMDEFHVADWWLDQSGVSPELATRQFNNIVAVEVQIGANAPVGRHRIQIHKVVVTTRLLSAGQLYSFLGLLWVLAIARLMIQRRREAELVQREIAARGHKMLDAIPQMVWAASASGYEYYNQRWAAFTGVELGGTTAVKRRDLVHPDDRERAAERWKQSLDTGEPYECEYRLLHRSGEYR
jgi:PAS domain-containing protein